MTQLEVIQKFVGALNRNDYAPSGDEVDTDSIESFDGNYLEKNSVTVSGGDRTTFTITRNIMDQAIRACSNYDGIDDAMNQFLAAAKAAPDSDTFLLNTCGINVHNNDTGGITGYDVGISAVERTSDTTVWEIGNTYTANNSAAQNINTGTHGWIVNATEHNDTINSSGEDIIRAGDGNDLIRINGRTAKITTGGNSDTISVGDDVKNFTVTDYNNNLKIVGAEDFDSVTNDDNSITYTRKGFDSIISPKSSRDDIRGWENTSGSKDLIVSDAINISLDKVNTITGSFSEDGTFTGGTTSTDAAGNVTSEFDSSFLDVASDGSLSFTVQGLKFNIIGERDPKTKKIINKITADNIDELKTTETVIPQYNSEGKLVDAETTKTYQYVTIANLYKWWGKESVNLNKAAQGIGFMTDGVGVNEIDVYFENYTEQDWLAYVAGNNVDPAGMTRKMEVVVNEKYFATVTDEDDPNGVAYFYTQYSRDEDDLANSILDRTLAHEFNHGLYNASINYFNYVPMYVSEGMAELIHGVDDERLPPMQELLNDYVNNSEGTYLKDFLSLDVLHSDHVATMVGGRQKGNYPYAGGYMFLRWLAKTASDATSDGDFMSVNDLSANVTLNQDGYYYISGGSSNKENATVSQDSDEEKYSVGVAENHVYEVSRPVKQTIIYQNGAWTIRDINTHNIITADNGDENDIIIGHGGHNSISTAGGDDTINVAGQFNTIFAGAGDDSVHNVSAYSYVDAGEGENYIQLNGSQGATITAGSGDDYIYQATETLEGNNGINSIILTRGNYQYINVADGNNVLDSITGNNFTVIAGDGNDSINFGDEDAKFNSVTLGGGNNAVTVTGASNTITSGSGNDSIVFTDYYESITSSNSYNTLDLGDGDNFIDIYSFSNTVTAGSGNDVARLSYTKSSLNAVDLGDGDDLFYIGGGNDNTIIGGSGSDTLSVYNDEESKIILQNLDAKDVIILTSAIDEIEVGENSMTLGDLTIILPDADAELINSFKLSDNGTMVYSDYEASDEDSEDVSDEGSEDVSDEDSEDVSDEGSEESSGDDGDDFDPSSIDGEVITNDTSNKTIQGTSKNDSITNSGSGVTINALSGNDIIKNSGRNTTIDGGSGENYVSLSSSSRNNVVYFNGDSTVDGFKTGFGAGSDTIYIEGDAPSVDFKTGGLTFYNSENSLTLKNINSNAQVILAYANGDVNPTAFIADDETYNVTDGAAKYYVGATSNMNHGISFAGVGEALDVTLNTDYEIDTGFWINNVHSITGGDNETKITGSDKSDTITAGTYKNTLIGGESGDVLIGSSGTSNYFVTAESGRDTIQSFNSGYDEIFVDDSIESVTMSDGNIIVNMTDANYSFLLQDMNDKIFDVNVAGTEYTARVANKKLTFDGETNYYNATGSSATIKSASDFKNMNVWLNQEVGKNFGNTTEFIGDIKYIDGSNATGNSTLAGSSEIENIITAGKGKTSLWGGGISNDTLVAGKNVDTFFYVRGDGNDTIKGAAEDDIVDLGNITLADIRSIEIENNSVVLNFTDDGSLSLNTNSGTNFKLGGQTYFYDKSSGNWQTK